MIATIRAASSDPNEESTDELLALQETRGEGFEAARAAGSILWERSARNPATTDRIDRYVRNTLHLLLLLTEYPQLPIAMSTAKALRQPSHRENPDENRVKTDYRA